MICPQDGPGQAAAVLAGSHPEGVPSDMLLVQWFEKTGRKPRELAGNIDTRSRCPCSWLIELSFLYKIVHWQPTGGSFPRFLGSSRTFLVCFLPDVRKELDACVFPECVGTTLVITRACGGSVAVMVAPQQHSNAEREKKNAECGQTDRQDRKVIRIST